jgi:hypothetical protein
MGGDNTMDNIEAWRQLPRFPMDVLGPCDGYPGREKKLTVRLRLARTTVFDDVFL